MAKSQGRPRIVQSKGRVSAPSNRPADRLAAQAAPAPARKSGAKTRVVTSLVFGLVFLFLFANKYSTSRKYKAPADQSSLSAEYSIVEDQLLDPNSPAWGSARNSTYWKNPQISDTEKKFCTGNQVSSFCKDQPLHPFVEVFDYYGMKLSFPSQKNTRTVAQFLEMDSRLFPSEK